MDYYYKDHKLVYLVGPVLLILIPLVFLIIANDLGLISKSLCLALVGLGIFSFIWEWRKKDRAWYINEGILTTPEMKIDLNEVKSVERESINEEIYLKMKLAGAKTVRLKSPYSARAGKELLSLLKQITKTKQEDDGDG